MLNDTKVFINTTSRADIVVIMAVPDPDKKQALLVEQDTPDLEVANKENMPGVQQARQHRFI